MKITLSTMTNGYCKKLSTLTTVGGNCIAWEDAAQISSNNTADRSIITPSKISDFFISSPHKQATPKTAYGIVKRKTALRSHLPRVEILLLLCSECIDFNTKRFELQLCHSLVNRLRNIIHPILKLLTVFSDIFKR